MDKYQYEKVPAIENNFQVKLRKYSDSARLNAHWHEHIELLFFLEGSCEFFCKGNTFSVEKDDLVVMNSTDVHSFTMGKDLDYVCILIYPEFFSDIKFHNVQLKTHIRGDKYVKECILEMNREYETDGVGSDMMLKSHTYRLIAYLLRNYTESHLSPKELALQNIKLARLSSILQYISSHYQEKITTKQLAEIAYLNENHFCRFFKKSVGKTVTDYLNEFRVEKAAVLLTATDQNISDIANSVGFEDFNYFSRIFKKHKSVSPTEYRKNN